MTIPKKELVAAYEQANGNLYQTADVLRKTYPNVNYSTVRSRLRGMGYRGKGTGGTRSIRPTDEVLRDAYERHNGHFTNIARELDVAQATVTAWMGQLGLSGNGREKYRSVYPQVIKETVEDGFVVCFSDAHLWFEEKSRAHEALLKIVKKIKPSLVVANGDVLDGARISRHDPSGLDPTPTLGEELHIAKLHMAELARACSGSKRYFTLGNHDSRLSRYLAIHAPEMDGVDGSRLDHHILGWTFCMALDVNDDVVIRHAFRGGIHATYNNTLHDGRTIVTGHLHAQMVRPFTDARGTRWGVDLGCLADPSWPQFNYTIAATKNWRSGFAVLEFRGGKLLPPQLVTVLDDGSVCWQRNEIL